MRQAKAECLSNAETFEREMTHLFSWGMFASGDELELEPVWTWSLAGLHMWQGPTVHDRELSLSGPSHTLVPRLGSLWMLGAEALSGLT